MGSIIQPGAPAKPAGPVLQGLIVIEYHADGNLVVKANVPSRPIANLMFETAKQDVLANLLMREQAQRQGAGLSVAPPELAGVNLRG